MPTLYTFGDSMTDTGNLRLLTDSVLTTSLPAETLGYTGGYTNGQVFSVYLAQLFGFSELENYSIAGARAAGTFSVWDFIAFFDLEGLVDVPWWHSGFNVDINLGAQIDRFVSTTRDADLDADVALIQIGTNDVFHSVTSAGFPSHEVLLALIEDVVAAIVGAVTTVLDAGMGHVVVNLLPAPEAFPFAEPLDPEAVVYLNDMMAYQNSRLIAELAPLIEDGAHVAIVNMGGFMAFVAGDPTGFGFWAPIESHVVQKPDGGEASLGDLNGYTLDQFAFYDDAHPTDAYHKVLAAFEAVSLVFGVQFLTEATSVFVGDSSKEYVFGTQGGDEIVLGLGEDTAFGGAGADWISGNGGADILSGGGGSDTLYGGVGDDILSAGDGDDALFGGDGNDVLVNGLGATEMTGGDGADMFIFHDAVLLGGDTNDAGSFVRGGHGEDMLRLLLSTETAAALGELVTSAEAVLDALSLSVMGVEDTVIFVEGEDLPSVEAERGFEAEYWGLL